MQGLSDDEMGRLKGKAKRYHVPPHYVANIEQKTGSGIAQLWVNIEQQSLTAKNHLFIPVSTESLCVSRRD